MAPPKIANCKRCTRIFQVRYSPYCPECYQVHQAHFSHVYNFVQEHPHMTLQDIARHCHLPLKEVEDLFYDGHLGTAAKHVIYHCQRCNRAMAGYQKQGRFFCSTCTGKIETEAKLNEKDPELLDDLPAAETPTTQAVKKRRMAEEEGNVLVSESPANTAEPPDETKAPESQSFGFKR